MGTERRWCSALACCLGGSSAFAQSTKRSVPLDTTPAGVRAPRIERDRAVFVRIFAVAPYRRIDQGRSRGCAAFSSAQQAIVVPSSQLGTRAPAPFSLPQVWRPDGPELPTTRSFLQHGQLRRDPFRRRNGLWNTLSFREYASSLAALPTPLGPVHGIGAESALSCQGSSCWHRAASIRNGLRCALSSAPQPRRGPVRPSG